MDDFTNELETLKKENAELKEKNDKLYKDCVSFAKRIKSSESSAARIEELEAEVEQLRHEMSKLASSERVSEYIGSDDSFTEPEEEQFPEAPLPYRQEDFSSQQTKLYEDEPYTDPYDDDPYDDDIIPKNHTVYKKSPVRTFVRVFLWIFLIFSMLVGIASLVAYLFSANFSNYGIANHRFATVTNSNMSPAVTKDDVILIKYSDFNGIELGSLVVTTKDTRSVAALKSIDVIDGNNIATVEDKNGEYSVNEDQFIGQVKLKIPFIGRVVQYACTNQYVYLAVVVGANLVFLALLLIIPSNKAKTPKFGKDYDVEDFTI
ncbi:MAG: hypothetical protein IIZ22_04735 [Clostridia bacterium]|nr:hypothetical protein [Clostridia bacterium]